MIYVALVLLGLCMGSFVNALVWRLRQQDTGKKLSKKQQERLSILKGRSMCSRCHHVLAWYDLLPVLSWVALRGKCRYCGHKIEDSPTVELGTVGLFIGSYMAWPYGFDTFGVVLFGFWVVFLVGFIALAVYDLRWMELPDRIVYPLIALAVAQVGFLATTEGPSELARALFGFLVIGGLFYILFQVSAGRWIGGGDVKLGFVIGPLVGGPLNSFLVIFLASFLGTLVSLPLLAKRSLKSGSRIPFGPFLLAATVVIYLYGDRMITSYLNLF